MHKAPLTGRSSTGRSSYRPAPSHRSASSHSDRAARAPTGPNTYRSARDTIASKVFGSSHFRSSGGKNNDECLHKAFGQVNSTGKLSMDEMGYALGPNHLNLDVEPRHIRAIANVRGSGSARVDTK